MSPIWIANPSRIGQSRHAKARAGHAQSLAVMLMAGGVGRITADGVTDKGHRVRDPLVGRARADEWLAMSGAALEDKTACRALAEGYDAGF